MLIKMKSEDTLRKIPCKYITFLQKANKWEARAKGQKRNQNQNSQIPSSDKELKYCNKKKGNTEKSYTLTFRLP